MLATAFAAAAILLATALQAQAGLINNQLDLAWASYRDQTSAQFSAKFEEMSDAGYRLIDIDAYSNGSGLLYSQIWEKGSDTRPWRENRDMTSAQFTTRHNQLTGQGFRLHDFESYRSGSTQYYAAIWVRNDEGWSVGFARDLTSSAYGSFHATQLNAGRRPVDLEAYPTADGLRFAAIWYPSGGTPWVALRNMDRDRYQEEVDDQNDAGYRMIDFESYSDGSTQRYAAIWEKKPAGRALAVRSDLTELGFSNVWRLYSDQGLRLVDFERYNKDGGIRYAGIWVENNPARYDYPRKSQLDAIIENYRVSNNNIPGISVAVILNGSLIYRRGFGYADINDGKWAHGGTIYNAASVSKVIGGTLAAKLEAEDELADGTTFDLDMTQLTSDYLSDIPVFGGTVSIPAHHTHKVEYLLSHLSCVAHYPDNSGDTPTIENQTTHRSSAVSAVRSIWQTGLVQGCVQNSVPNYSTPALTFVAAVLERATGRRINRLLREELFEPYGLDSMRVQFETASLPANYDRATPYKNDNVEETSYEDSSWKVLGGGIETSAVDLATFGWKVLSGQIVSASVRDNRLFAAVQTGCGNSTANGCEYGLAWQRAGANGRSVVQHDGSWRGARSFIRLYRTTGFTDPRPRLVIAIMSNRRSGTPGVHNPAVLATDIAAEVLATDTKP